MEPLQIVLLVIGVLLLIGAFTAYWKDTSKAIFPALFAVCGIFLCGAQTVRANIPGIGEIELLKTTAERTSEAALALSDASEANKEAIAAINEELVLSRTAFEDYREEINKRFRQLNQSPVGLPEAAQIQRSQTIVEQRIRAAQEASSEVRSKSDALRVLQRASE